MTSNPNQNAGQSVVLVVDDEESMRYFLQKTLSREGYHVLTAADGPEAIAVAQTEPPDLALVDIRMPGMDGVALMRALRATLPHLPVVLMTGFGSVQSALNAMRQGATDYITKPFRVEPIRAKVAAALATPADQARPPTIRASSASAESVSPAATQFTAGRRRPRARPDAAAGQVETPERGLVAYLTERAEERDLPAGDLIGGGDLGLRDVTRLAEMVWVDEVLRLTGGNISRAAEMAGITRPNMHRKVSDLGLDADDYRGAPRY